MIAGLVHSQHELRWPDLMVAGFVSETQEEALRGSIPYRRIDHRPRRLGWKPFGGAGVNFYSRDMSRLAQDTRFAIPHKRRRVMKALSVRQPWASRILRAEKRIEVRSWTTEYRGPLVICATLRPRIKDLPVGAALCVVQLLDCRPMTVADEPAAGVRAFPGAYAWVLGKVTPIEPPVALSGRLGLFDVEIAGLVRTDENHYRQTSLFGVRRSGSRQTESTTPHPRIKEQRCPTR